MSLRAKRAALTAKVVGAPGGTGGPGEGTSGVVATPSPALPTAGSGATASPAPSGSPSPDTVATQRGKLDQIAASFVPTIIGGHQAKQPPSYIFEESVRQSCLSQMTNSSS